jgi:preprotein translocase subunit SecB
MVENLTWQLEVWTLSNGGGFYSEDGKEVIINKPESIEAIQKVADLYLKEHVAPLSFCIERNIAMKESSFQLIGKPQVTNIRFEVNKDYIFNKEVTLEINSNIRVLRNSREQKKESIVILSIGIFSSKELPDVPFKLDIEIQGCFAWDGVLDNDTAQLESMLRQNAPAALFSYLRPIVTLITVEANMPPLVLPLMNFIEKE